MDRLRQIFSAGVDAARMQLASAGYWADVMVGASIIEAGEAAPPPRSQQFERDVSAELRRRRRGPH